MSLITKIVSVTALPHGWMAGFKDAERQVTWYAIVALALYTTGRVSFLYVDDEGNLADPKAPSTFWKIASPAPMLSLDDGELVMDHELVRRAFISEALSSVHLDRDERAQTVSLNDPRESTEDKS